MVLMTKVVVEVVAVRVPDDDIEDDDHHQDDDDGDVEYVEYGDRYGDGETVHVTLYCGDMIIRTMVMTMWCMEMGRATPRVLIKWNCGGGDGYSC